jgi:hypothetical protein
MPQGILGVPDFDACGTLLADNLVMYFQCQHCEQLVMGKAYRVISQESGITLLDMMVCHHCFIDAQRLGLKGQELRPSDDYDSAPRYQA